MGKQDQTFVRSSLRHLAALRDAGPACGDASAPFPDDWFNLPQDTMADFGAMFYLAALNRFHANLTLPQALAQFEPPLRLNQYRIFRSGGFPRAFITWAGLGHGAETRLAIDHKPLKAHQWNSGTSKWVIDLVAPFGHLDDVIKQLSANNTETRLRTLWHNKTGSRYRILEWARAELDQDISVRSYGVGQFRKLLEVT